MHEPRVLILSDYAGGGASAGGAGRVVIDSGAALRQRGVAVEIVTGFGDAPAGGESLGGRDLRQGGDQDAWRAIWNPAARDALAPVLARHHPACTVVILHQWTRWLSPAIVAQLGAFRTMVYLHDHFWACPNGAYYHFPDRKVCDRQPLGVRCLATQCDRAGRLAKLGRVARHAALTGAR